MIYKDIFHRPLDGNLYSSKEMIQDLLELAVDDELSLESGHGDKFNGLLHGFERYIEFLRDVINAQINFDSELTIKHHSRKIEIKDWSQQTKVCFIEKIENAVKNNLQRNFKNPKQSEISISLSLNDVTELLKTVSKYRILINLLKINEHMLSDLNSIYLKAVSAYESYGPDKRQEDRLREVSEILKIKTGSKRPAKINKARLFWEYLSLLNKSKIIKFEKKDILKLNKDTIIEVLPNDKKKIDEYKWQAMELLAKKYNIASKESCCQHIKIYISELKKGGFWKPEAFNGLLPYSESAFS